MQKHAKSTTKKRRRKKLIYVCVCIFLFDELCVHVTRQGRRDQTQDGTDWNETARKMTWLSSRIVSTNKAAIVMNAHMGRMRANGSTRYMILPAPPRSEVE